MEGEGEKLTRTCIHQALSGNMIAMRLCLDRVVPVRGARLKLDIPEIKAPADVVTAIAAIITAAASGKLSPDEAASLASVISAQHKAIELIDLARRVSALEEADARNESTAQ